MSNVWVTIGQGEIYKGINLNGEVGFINNPQNIVFVGSDKQQQSEFGNFELLLSTFASDIPVVVSILGTVHYYSKRKGGDFSHEYYEGLLPQKIEYSEKKPFRRVVQDNAHINLIFKRES